MNIINHLILKLLLTLNFLNAILEKDRRLGILQLIDKTTHREQMNILKSNVQQYENKVKASFNQYIKEINNYKNNEEEISISNFIYKKYKIMVNIAKLQDMIQDYKCYKKKDGLNHIIYNLKVQKQKIKSMKTLLNQLNISMQETKEKLDNDLLTKIYKIKFFVKKENIKLTLKNILYQFILVALILFISLMIAFIAYYISLIYKIIISIIIFFALYMIYHYFFK